MVLWLGFSTLPHPADTKQLTSPIALATPRARVIFDGDSCEKQRLIKVMDESICAAGSLAAKDEIPAREKLHSYLKASTGLSAAAFLAG